MLRKSAAVAVASLLSVPAASLAMPVADQTGAVLAGPARPAVSSATDDYFAAIALRDSDLPGGLHEMDHRPVSADDASVFGGDLTQSLNQAGFLAGYTQVFFTDNLLGVFGGAPVAGGDLITVFTNGLGASIWNTTEAQNAGSVAQQIGSTLGASISINGSAAFDLPSVGDEATGVELTGNGSVQGESLDVYIDAAFVRRGATQFTIVMAGLQSEQGAAISTARALDARVQAAGGSPSSSTPAQ